MLSGIKSGAPPNLFSAAVGFVYCQLTAVGFICGRLTAVKFICNQLIFCLYTVKSDAFMV